MFSNSGNSLFSKLFCSINIQICFKYIEVLFEQVFHILRPSVNKWWYKIVWNATHFCAVFRNKKQIHVHGLKWFIWICVKLWVLLWTVTLKSHLCTLCSYVSALTYSIHLRINIWVWIKVLDFLCGFVYHSYEHGSGVLVNANVDFKNSLSTLDSGFFFIISLFQLQVRFWIYSVDYFNTVLQHTTSVYVIKVCFRRQCLFFGYFFFF